MPAELYSYTGSDLALEVKRQFGDTGNVQITDDHILRWINNGQRSIASTSPFLEATFTTNLLAGQAEYNLNALMAASRVQSYASVVANGRKLRFVAWQKYLDDDFRDDFDDDDPWVYTEFAGKITLVPAPQDSVPAGLTIYFMQWPADLEAIADDLTVPDRYYNSLVAYVLARALELDENFDAAANQLQQHASALAVEIGRDQLNPTDAYPFVTYVEP